VYEWYAPIQWPPVFSVSKEITLLWIKARLATSNQAKSSPTSPSNDYGYTYVKSDALNVRSGPSANNRVVTNLMMNSRVQVIGKTGAWWKIRYENTEGYVNSQYLADQITPVNAPPRSEVRSNEAPVLPRLGTTRDPEFQRVYEEASAEANRYRGVPPGLVLPTGETVAERLESGTVYVK
jgi:uncharacterized protein YraI